MEFVSDEMAQAVAGSAEEIAGALGPDGRRFLAAVVAFAHAEDGTARREVALAGPGDAALADAVLRIAAAWPAERWREASAWQLVLSAYCLRAPRPPRAA